MLLNVPETAEANEDKEGELTMEHDTVVEVQELFRTKCHLATSSSCNSLISDSKTVHSSSREGFAIF